MIESMEAVKTISRHRDNALIVATMTMGTELPIISEHPELDILFNFAAMGKASSVGLGLALAQPTRKVIVMDSDGAMMMNLGGLMTVTNMAPANFTQFLFQNDMYRCTGGQPLPRAGKVNFANLAREAGYANVYEIDDLATLEKDIDGILKQKGPNFVRLKIAPGIGAPYPYVAVADTVPGVRAALGT